MLWSELNDHYNRAILDTEAATFKAFRDAPHTEEATVTQAALVTPESDEDAEAAFERLMETKLQMDKKLNALEVIQMQLKVVNHMSRHFKLYRLDNLDTYLRGLHWICDTSELLASSIKQPVNRNKTNILMRSSYKFCNKKADCQNQYGFLFNKKTKGCINDHYVHNKVVSDIDNLLNYIEKNRNCPDQHVNLETELRKGIETVNYVVNHMHQELSSFMLYFGDNKQRYTIKDFYRHTPSHTKS
jgi:hypothetical protein